MNKESLIKSIQEAKHATSWQKEADKLIFAMEKFKLI